MYLTDLSVNYEHLNYFSVRDYVRCTRQQFQDKKINSKSVFSKSGIMKACYNTNLKVNLGFNL